MGLSVDRSKALPSLVSVSGTPLSIMGMAKVEIGVGNSSTCSVNVAVVPDAYLSRDVLLGCDVLTKGDLVWRSKNKVVVWGGHAYDVAHIRRNSKNVAAVRHVKKVIAENSIQVKTMVRLQPFQSKVVQVRVDEPVGVQLLVTLPSKIASQTTELLVRVSNAGTVPIIIENHSKVWRFVKAGTIVGRYVHQKGDLEVVPESVNHTRISNEIIPELPEEVPGRSRREKLEGIIDAQDWSHLSTEMRTTLKELVLAYPDLFIVGPEDLGLIKGEPAHIYVRDDVPCRTPSYRYPESAKAVISEMLDGMEAKGIIEPSTAAWLSPIVLVSKGDGSKRMCLDFRRVNEHLAADVHPLPRLDDLVNLASGHKYYATLDLKDAYYQIELDEESRDVTTFSDGVSLYRFKRLPFGLSCAPAVFSRKIANVLAPLLKEGWLKNYLDDIILFAPTYEILLTRLGSLFRLLSEYGIKLNLKKCELVKDHVKFLGHVVSEEGSLPDSSNLKAIEEMRAPKNVRDVRRFVGMCSFYRKFVPKFSQIVSPLTELTKSSVAFVWSDRCQAAFDNLKEQLRAPPVLASYNPELPLVLVTDASDTCVGGVLHQGQPSGELKPLGYFSKKMSPCETRYSVTDKEALGIVLSCRHFHQFLWGRRFTIWTDHQPLVTIFKRHTKSPRVTRWMLEMREYDFVTKYVMGKSNVVADQLSRPVRVITREPVGSFLGLEREDFVNKQRGDGTWEELVNYLNGGRIPGRKIPRENLEQFEVSEGVLYFVRQGRDGALKYCLVVPTELKGAALRKAHDDKGHFGQWKSIKACEDQFYWPNLRGDCRKWVKECKSCQAYKAQTGLSTQYRELPSVTRPMQRIAIDLTDMHNGQDSNRYILTIIDHFSRYVKFYPLRSKVAGSIVEKLSGFIRDFGVPETLLLDNAMEFRGHEMRQWADAHGIVLLYTTPYHPQGNGVIERMHRTLKTVLGQLCQGYPHRWPSLVGKCQALMNGAVHSATGSTPFVAFFGRHPHRGPDSALPCVPSTEEERVKLQELIVSSSQKSQRNYRGIANRRRKRETLGVGALVWVRVEHTMPGTCSKLNPRWKGPYKVVEVRNDGVGYVVENLYTGARIQRAAEKLRPFVSRGNIIPEMVEEPDPVRDEVEDEVDLTVSLPPRVRRPPPRLIEEM